MPLSAPLLMLVGAVGWSILAKLLDEGTRFKRRSIDEVADMMRKPDEEQLQDLLDRVEDLRLRFPLFANYRRDQRVRLDKLREQYYRLDHNSTIVYQWADTEWRDMVRHRLQESYEPELIGKIKEARLAGIKFHITMRFVLAEIWFLSLIHFDVLSFIPIPSVAALARSGGTDIRNAYQRVKDAAVVLAAVHGEEREFANEIEAAM